MSKVLIQAILLAILLGCSSVTDNQNKEVFSGKYFSDTLLTDRYYTYEFIRDSVFINQSLSENDCVLSSSKGKYTYETDSLCFLNLQVQYRITCSGLYQETSRIRSCAKVRNVFPQSFEMLVINPDTSDSNIWKIYSK